LHELIPFTLHSDESAKRSLVSLDTGPLFNRWAVACPAKPVTARIGGSRPSGRRWTTTATWQAGSWIPCAASATADSGLTGAAGHRCARVPQIGTFSGTACVFHERHAWSDREAARHKCIASHGDVKVSPCVSRKHCSFGQGRQAQSRK
jgi:hypothetical protein